MGSADWNSASNGRAALKRSGKLKSIPTPPPSCGNTGPTSSDLPTSPPSSDLPPLMLFAEVSPARMSPWLVPEQGLRESDQPFGPNSSDSFAKLNPDGLWLKTYQGFSQATVDGSWETFSETWPQSGSMRNGECFLRPEWEAFIGDEGSSFLPTPTANPNQRKLTEDGKSVDSAGRRYGVTLPQLLRAMLPTPVSSMHKQGKTYSGGNPTLNGLMAMIPIPCASDFKGGSKNGRDSELKHLLKRRCGGTYPHPSFVEWMMGFKIDHTDLNASETPSSPKSRKRSGK